MLIQLTKTFISTQMISLDPQKDTSADEKTPQP
jgi:hypothetical protein